MASEVDICNLALGHLGDTATVASIDPPEGSAQAEHCARFYPIARDTLLEMHSWNFATRRVLLAELEDDWSQWAYAYAKPADCVRVLAVMHYEANDDYAMTPVLSAAGMPIFASAQVPQDFVVEVNDEGADVIRTHQAEAAARYVARITDTSRFSALFVLALSHHLASMLAGPVLKGDAGSAEAKRQQGLVQVYLAQASVQDARQRQVKPPHVPAWVQGR